MKRCRSMITFVAAPGAALFLLPAFASAQKTAALGPSEPMPVIGLRATPAVFDPAQESEAEAKKPADGAKWLSKYRLGLLTERDGKELPAERVEAYPREFCYQNRCVSNYKALAGAMYGTKKGADRLPAFCAPRRVGGKWNVDRVHCSTNWISTLGGWMPWTAKGLPNKAPEKGVLPPFACFGNPEFLKRHTVLPPGSGSARNGFNCRKRIFKILATKPEKSVEDRNQNIVAACLNLRQQTWGEKYPEINTIFRRWCLGKNGPKDKSLCPKKGAKLPGQPGAPALPFMQLTREELLYFFGHSEHFCRADRAGLIHFLDPAHTKWATSFSCGVGRGVIEGGPFEEGVQVCAVAPYIAEPAPTGQLVKDPFKARLHCWKFQRPTCEQLSQPEQAKQYLYLGNVFDVYDTLKEFRRTRMTKVFDIFDLKDSEKLGSYGEMVAFSDTAKDENAFGIKDFCRFVGDTKHIQCGYTRESMARWYEMRQFEEPDASCAQGVCARGAYRRGYYCGMFRTDEMFKGKPYWMCGLDVGPNGQKKLANARSICVGGQVARDFQSSKGDKTSLQCYDRRFKWAENEASQQILLTFSWDKIFQKALTTAGGVGPDQAAFSTWAKTFGHTLGHRTSQRIGLMRADIPSVKAFQKIVFAASDLQGLPAKDVAPKVKDLNDLIYEVIKGDRAADAGWWQELQGATVEEGKIVLARGGAGKLAIAKRLHKLVRVLDIARQEVLQIARKYAETVYAHAPKVKDRLSRLELHQRSRVDVRQQLRGNAFCSVEQLFGREDETVPANFVCASSPLLVAGMVEMVSRRRFEKEAAAEQKKPGRAQDVLLQKLRNQVKTEWCYGAAGSSKVRGLIWDRQSKLAPLYQPDLSSPFLMEPGKGVLDPTSSMVNALKPFNWRSRTNWIKCTGFQYSDENWERAVPSRGEAARPTQTAGLQLPAASLTMPSGGGPKTKEVDTSAAQRAIDEAAKGDARAKKAAEIVSKVGGLVGDLIKMVLPGLGKAISYISNLINEAIDFIEEYKGKFLETSEAQWTKADETYKAGKEAVQESFKGLEEAKTTLKNEITAAKEELEKATVEAQTAKDKRIEDARGELEKKKDAYKDAQVAAAAAKGDAKEAADEKALEAKNEWNSQKGTFNSEKTEAGKDYVKAVNEATQAAQKRINDAVKALNVAQKAYDKAVKTDETNATTLIKGLITVSGSAKLFEQMLTDLSKRAAGKVMELIEPQARDLFGKGFRFVRMILGIVAKAIISALASIPFVGGVLAAAGQIAYDFGLNMLEDFCFEQLKGLVERFFATIIRAQLSLVATGLKKTVLRGVQASHCKNFKHLCPSEELKLAELPSNKKWLERAFACGGGLRLPDSVYKDAIAARQRIIQTGKQMQKEAPLYAKNLANKYFARFGLTYDSWMLAVGADAREQVVARAAEITRQLEKDLAAERSKIRPSRLPD